MNEPSADLASKSWNNKYSANSQQYVHYEAQNSCVYKWGHREKSNRCLSYESLRNASKESLPAGGI